MAQETSIEAYYNFEQEGKLGKLQRDVLNIIRIEKSLTNTEIAKILNKPINTIVPRVWELRKKGLVKEKGKRACRINGKRVIEWGIV